MSTLLTDTPNSAQLDISKDARLKRLRDLGFNTEIVLFHGSGAKFDVFERGRASLIFFTPQEDYARQYGEVGRYYLNLGRVFDMVNNFEHRQLAIDLFNERGGWRVGYEENYIFTDEELFARGGNLSFNAKFDELWEIIDEPETNICNDILQNYDTIVMEECREQGYISYGVCDPLNIRSVDCAM